MIMTSPLSVPFVGAAAGHLAMPSLIEWTQALQEVEPHPLEGDGQEAMTFLGPMLADLNRPDLADRFQDSDGAQAWILEPDNSRVPLMHHLVGRFSAQNIMSLRSEALHLRQSIGRDRPVSLAAFGELDKNRPESWEILDMVFPHKRGLGLHLEIPARARPLDTHRVYFSNRRGTWPRDHAFDGFIPITPFEPLVIGNLSIGGLNAADLPFDLEQEYGDQRPVDILMISGAVSDDIDRFEQLARLFSTRLILARIEGLEDSFTDDVGTSTLLVLGPAAKHYLTLCYNPNRRLLWTEIYETNSEEVSYRNTLRLGRS